MDPVSASENFLQQVGQKLVRALFGGKKTEEKKQEATEEDGEPNVSAQGVETTVEVGETPVDPSNESAVSVQENRDDAPSTSPPGPDISERSHLGQTEHSIPQESETKSSDSSQPTAADEEVTESCHWQDDQSTQTAATSVKPLESLHDPVLQGDTCATKSGSLIQPNRSECSAEERVPVVESEALSCHDQVDWNEDVQGNQLHSDSQGLQNAPEDTTMWKSAAPTGVKEKFISKPEFQGQMHSEESLHGSSVAEALYIQENQEKHPMSHRTDNEKLVTQTGQLQEHDNDTVDVGDTDETALESGVSSTVKEITTSCDSMIEEVQPGPLLGGRKIQKKSSRIQAGIQDTPVSADTLETTRDLGAGGVHEESLLPQARTEESDTPVTVDISHPDQESGAGTNHEKSPHSHADAKTNESVVPAIPSYTQTETKESDITMPVDASEADQERETSQAFLNNIINRRWSSFKALPSLSQTHDIVRQLCGKLMGNRVLVLLGEPGSGKTTAAILLAQYAPIWCDDFEGYLYYGDDEYIPETVTDFPSKSLIVVDNFLGRYDTDSLSYWDTVVPLLESMKENAHKQILLLLTSRTTIFQNLLSSEETDVRFFLDENHVMTITIDYRKMWTDICADVKLKTPDFENLPSIGFPLCCQLVPHLAPDVQTILFQQPMLALRRTVKTLLDSNDIARTALTLLAVTDGSLNMNIFTSLARLQESTCPEILDFLPKASSDKETPAQIVEFYRNCAYLIQVGNDAVSFRSEVIQEAVLVVLCDSHADVLAKYCSLKLLSQIALATSDKDTSDDAEKPALSDSARKVFLRRFRQEMEDSDHFDVMVSPYFQHHLFLSMFESAVKEVGLLKQWTQKCSQSGLHFVFCAGSVPSVFRSALSELDKKNLWVVLQAVLACCYWGYNSDISDLMKVWKNKTDLKKALKEATIGDIVTGDLPGVSGREEPQWELIPLFPEDTLLVMAARRGNDAVVKTLAFRDMNVNSQGMAGRTALMHYCARGRRDMVEFLLGREADPMIRDDFHMTALMYALQRKQWDIPQKLLTTESCRAENTYLQTPLTFACSHEWSTQMIKTLIDKGADLLQSDKWGYTCLHNACLYGHTDIVAYLLKEKKVDVHGKSAFGHTPFTLAVTGPGRSKLAKLLLNTEATNDAEIIEVTKMICRASDCSVMETLLSAYHKKEDAKNFALLLGSLYGNTEMVQYLLQSGAEAGATYNVDAYTALHYACFGFSVDCCEILLKKIDPNVESKIGATPLMYALQYGALDCARLLLRQGAKLNLSSAQGSCLHHATLSNLCSVLDWCIKENKMNVNFGNKSGKTPLQVACEEGKYHSVKYLLDNGADILKADNNEDTCLHHAARSGHWDIVRLLEKVDPSLMNVPNKKGETPAQLLKTTAPASQSTSAE